MKDWINKSVRERYTDFETKSQFNERIKIAKRNQDLKDLIQELKILIK